MYETMEDVSGLNNGSCRFVDENAGTIVNGPGFEGGDRRPSYKNADVDPMQYFLPDGEGGSVSIQNAMCSPSCCSNQWPSTNGSILDDDPYVCAMKKNGDLVGSNLMCNNLYQDSGCLCLDKKTAKHLYNRGGNSNWL